MGFLGEEEPVLTPNSCPAHNSNTPWHPEPHPVTQERSNQGVSAEAAPESREVSCWNLPCGNPLSLLSSSFPVLHPKSIPCCFIYPGNKHSWQHSSVDRQVPLSSPAQLVPLCCCAGRSSSPRPQKAAQHRLWLQNASHLTCLSLSWGS